jgi:hypothetical protein
MPRIETKSPPGPGSSLSAIVNDLIPVCLGGNNASPLNHWPQLISGELGAEAKDAFEHRACSEICLIATTHCLLGARPHSPMIGSRCVVTVLLAALAQWLSSSFSMQLFRHSLCGGSWGLDRLRHLLYFRQ